MVQSTVEALDNTDEVLLPVRPLDSIGQTVEQIFEPKSWVSEHGQILGNLFARNRVTQQSVLDQEKQERLRAREAWEESGVDSKETMRFYTKFGVAAAVAGVALGYGISRGIKQFKK